MSPAIKINPHDCQPIPLAQRTNYKMVDPTTVGSKHLTFGMVVVEPFGVCEPGHSHEEQEEIFFAHRQRHHHRRRRPQGDSHRPQGRGLLCRTPITV